MMKRFMQKDKFNMLHVYSRIRLSNALCYADHFENDQIIKNSNRIKQQRNAIK